VPVIIGVGAAHFVFGSTTPFGFGIVAHGTLGERSPSPRATYDPRDLIETVMNWP
jgi:hypothetical protein